jgi:hypothetical protein
MALAIKPGARCIATYGGLLLAMFACMLANADTAESYSDQIYLVNGDRVTGNIKRLDRGKLELRTETMDTVFLSWSDVAAVDTNKYLRIEKIDGSFHYGQLHETSQASILGITDESGESTIERDSIASMRPLRVNEKFYQRLTGEVKAGMDYSKGSDILNINVASDIRLREEKYEITAGLDWNETRRSEANDASRARLDLDYTRFRDDRWFWKASGAVERNDYLGLDFRTIGTATVGNYLINSPIMRFEINGGLAANHEENTGGDAQTSAEGVLSSSFDIFMYQIPITRLSIFANLYPGISEQGRVRFNAGVNLRNEIVRDFFWDLQLYTNYDNKSPGEAGNTDYGVITSVGTVF